MLKAKTKVIASYFNKPDKCKSTLKFTLIRGVEVGLNSGLNWLHSWYIFVLEIYMFK